jgi:POT family proton-dependent oligopeptide transporter
MSTPIMAAATPAGRRGTFRQPKSLYLVSVFELAERFSYFGMLAILVYYVYFPVAQGGLGLSQTVATSLVGAYGGGIYLATVLGGWLADRILGAARTLLVGAVLVLAGHVALALLPGFAGLIAGLVLVALGSGCTKPTTASVVGSLYKPGDAQRIVGFTLFYLSLNIGALFGGMVTGFLQQSFGFHVGFGAAAAGMVAGLLIYIPAAKRFPESTRVVPSPAPRSARIRAAAIALGVVAVVAAAFSTGIVQASDSSTLVALAGVFVAVVYYVLMGRSAKVTKVEYNTVLRYLPIFVASAVQVALWMQLYTAVSIHAEARTDRALFGLDLPPSTVVASGAVFAIVLTPVMNAIWNRLGTRQPGTAVKYALSLLTLALCYAVLGVTALDDSAIIPIMLVIGVVGGFYLADLIASPTGLSYATAAAPMAFRTQMVSVHSMSYAIGAALAGVVARFYNPEVAAGGYFLGLAGITVLVALVLFMIRRVVVDGDQLSAASTA